MNSPTRVVALDIDGTLAGADHRVSQRSLRSLAALQNAGVDPVIVTGRTETAALHIAQAAGLTAPVISCNGAMVTTPGRGIRLRQTVFSEEDIQVMLAWVNDQDRLELFLWSQQHIYAERRSNASRTLEAINNQEVSLGAFDDVDTRSIVKVMISGPSDRLDAVAGGLTTQFPFFKRSMDTFIEGSAPGASKWESLLLVLENLGATPEECLGIADGDTDIEWLSRIGEAIAVKNARPGVLAVADTVIGHHASDAVSTFLDDRFGLGRR